VNQIVDGTCREYNYTELITPEEYVKYAAQIDRAYKYRSDKIKKMERNMRVIYICGEPGAGKTTYAKEIAKEQGYRPFLAGSSNDPLDGYKGEDCLILDDLRASSMSISDLLKMLDNHTGSLVRSRYRNKFLECKLVIITSIKTIDELYTMFLEQSEPLDQFKRRCSTMIHMTKEKVRVFGWDISKSDYEHIVTWPNFVLANIKKVYLTDEKKEEIKRELLGSKKAMVEKMIEEEEEGEEEEKEAMGEVLKIFGGEVVNTNFKLPKS
jgi:adenylate kinase family enzyme